MIRHHVRGISGLTIALLLALPAGTLIAQEQEVSFDRPMFQLDGVLTLADFELLPPVATSNPDTSSAREFESLDLTDTVQLYGAQQDMDFSPRVVEAQHKSFGRWLKKHWYIPTILGVAAGVLLLDDDTDDPNEDDD